MKCLEEHRSHRSKFWGRAATAYRPKRDLGVRCDEGPRKIYLLGEIEALCGS